MGPVWRMERPLELGRVPLKASLPPQRDKFPADGDHNLDSLPTLAMSAGALGALQVREGSLDRGKGEIWAVGVVVHGRLGPGSGRYSLMPAYPVS